MHKQAAARQQLLHPRQKKNLPHTPLKRKYIFLFLGEGKELQGNYSYYRELHALTVVLQEKNMDKQETQRLFNLIDTLYPSAKRRPRTPADIEAWTLVLEPWAYEDVKQAVIIRARENRFPPDASELMPYLPKPEVRADENQPIPEPSPAHLEKFYGKANALQARFQALHIPPPHEARKQGITYAGWCAMADLAGIQEVPYGQ